jgi:hypothetical protein
MDTALQNLMAEVEKARDELVLKTKMQAALAYLTLADR